MRLTKLGHSCLLIEAGTARLLIDPGTLSVGFEDVRGLTAILVTHQHADHLDTERIGALVHANPDAQVIADTDSVELLNGLGVAARKAVAGDRFDLGVDVQVVGADHAVIHPDIPMISNVGYLVGERLLHPGDALTVPEQQVEILALPTVAPWMALAEAVDFLRALAPAVAVPIHDAPLRDPNFYHRFFRQLQPADTQLSVLDNGASLAL